MQYFGTNGYKEKISRQTGRGVRQKKGVVFRIYQTSKKTFLAAYNFVGEKGKIHRANREAFEFAMSEAVRSPADANHQLDS